MCPFAVPLKILSNAANFTGIGGTTLSRTSWVEESSCAACSTITEQEIFLISLIGKRQERTEEE